MVYVFWRHMRSGGLRRPRDEDSHSKKIENHCHAAALYAVWYNFCRPHKTLKGDTPAMAAGLVDRKHSLGWIVGLIDERAPALGPRGPYKPRNSK